MSLKNAVSPAETMKERLDAMPYKSELWRERYPNLVTVWEDEPAAPKGNRVVHNVSWGGKWDGVQEGARPYQSIEDNLVDQDPGFATPDRFGDALQPRATDFALKPDSPAFGVGFKALPLDQNQRAAAVADLTESTASTAS